MVVMRTIGDRLLEARKALGITQEELAKEAGVSKQAVSAIELGSTRNPEAATIDPICRRLRINARWLLTERGPRDAITESEDWADVKAHKVAASLGAGLEPDEYAETFKLKFRADSLRRKNLRPDQLGVCYGVGDSMNPRIQNGDAILFDTGETTPKDGAIFVVSYGKDLLAKRLVQLGGRWFFESLNKDHPEGKKPRPVDETKHFVIHGRVRWIGSWED